MITYEEARALRDSGNIRKAHEYFTMLVNQSKSATEKANYLIEDAECLRQLEEFNSALTLVYEAKQLVSNDDFSSDQIDYFAATLLVAQGKRADGLQLLTIISNKYSMATCCESRELYEQAQLQRAFALMHLGRYPDARVVLEEVVLFPLQDEYRRDAHTHLGSCYFELKEYSLAKKQFETVKAIGVSDEWARSYHYEFGFTLFKLKEFAAAKRELLLCLQSGSDASGLPQSYVYKLLAATYAELREPGQARIYRRLARIPE